MADNCNLRREQISHRELIPFDANGDRRLTIGWNTLDDQAAIDLLGHDLLRRANLVASIIEAKTRAGAISIDSEISNHSAFLTVPLKALGFALDVAGNLSRTSRS